MPGLILFHSHQKKTEANIQQAWPVEGYMEKEHYFIVGHSR